MADEPVIKSGVDFLNHVTSTLNRCSGQWSFASFPTWDGLGHVDVVFHINGGRYQIWYSREDGWHVIDERRQEACQRIAGMLNGQVRDEAGNISSPLRVEAGKWYERRDGAVAGPAERNSGYESHPWSVGAYTYTDDGMQGDFEESGVDLIREVPARASSCCDS